MVEDPIPHQTWPPIGPVVSEEKIFEKIYRRTTDAK
jgi:hypothetical protein